ncbi:M66 family metalloprotease [Pseudomonas sp. CGJS7]|uniref:M66 family metalloprotease n=1 Tax=Pseudomonas sp. CGJS7 TaxID=3109348 RepID=UPI003009240E
MEHGTGLKRRSIHRARRWLHLPRPAPDVRSTGSPTLYPVACSAFAPLRRSQCATHGSALRTPVRKRPTLRCVPQKDFAMPPRLIDQIATGIHRAWQESFVERYRLWSARVSGIEVTQAIQYHRANEHLTDSADRGADNSVQLIAFKAAWVRVYVRAGLLGSIANVTGTLELSRRNRLLQYELVDTYTPQGGSVDAEQALIYRAERSDLDHSLNFVIPASEFYGTLRLTARLTGHDDSEKSVGVSAHLVQTLRVRGILVAYDGDSTSAPSTPGAPVTQLTLPAPTLADLQSTAATALAAMPVQATGSFAVCANMTWNLPLDDARVAPGKCSDNWNSLLDAMSLLRDNDGNRDDVVYYGLLPNGIPLGVPGCGDDGLGAAANGNDQTFLHETGHGYGFQHTPCGSNGNTDPNYPTYEPYMSASIGEFGFDIRDGTIHDPQLVADYMSYCRPRWMSLYQHRRLLSHPRLAPEWLPPDFPELDPLERPFYLEHLWWPDPPWRYQGPEWRMTPVISVQGWVLENGRIEVDSVARIQVVAPALGIPTQWSAQLLDEQGGVLSRAVLMRREPQGGGCCCGGHDHRQKDEPPFAFRAYLRNVAPGASLRIDGPDKQTWSRKAGAQPPRFTHVAAKVSGEKELVLEWKLDAADIKDVWAQWRRDDKDAWHGLVIGLRDNQARLPLQGLPPHRIQVRLIAHDGFHSSESEPITVELPEREPVLAIVSPSAGGTFRVGRPMQLQGNLTDSSGQPLPDDQLTWWLDGVQIGHGRERWLAAPAEGQHELTVQAQWSKGVAKRSVKFTTERKPERTG